MPPEAKTVLSGLTEVGHVSDPYGTPSDVSWGATEQDGAALIVNGQQVEVQSAQSKILEDSFATGADVRLRMTLQYSDLLNYARALGLDESSHPTGDLQAGTPVEEVLEPTVGELFNREFYIYLITPGPASTRRVELKRCKANPQFQVPMGSTDYQKLELEFYVLRPTQSGHEDTPFKITDAV